MKPIDEHLFERLYVRFPKVGTLYYAMRQPIPIALLAFFGILLAVPCGIAVGIMHGVFATANEMSESVRTAAYRFKRYTANLKALWQVATITTTEGGEVTLDNTPPRNARQKNENILFSALTTQTKI